MIEGDAFKRICEADEVVFTRLGFHHELEGPITGPAGRLAALTELLEYGSLGMPTIEKRGKVLYVRANWNFVG